MEKVYKVGIVVVDLDVSQRENTRQIAQQLPRTAQDRVEGYLGAPLFSP
jgi:hypothetical protein